MRWTEEQLQAYQARRSKTPLPAPEYTSVKSAIRQSRRQPNKTERRFELEYLTPMMRCGDVADYGYEEITLRLANGVRYTPDWWAVTPVGLTRFFEVKGRKVWDDAIVKLKVAATEFARYEFWLCCWDSGEWRIERVLP